MEQVTTDDLDLRYYRRALGSRARIGICPADKSRGEPSVSAVEVCNYVHADFATGPTPTPSVCSIYRK